MRSSSRWCAVLALSLPFAARAEEPLPRNDIARLSHYAPAWTFEWAIDLYRDGIHTDILEKQALHTGAIDLSELVGAVPLAFGLWDKVRVGTTLSYVLDGTRVRTLDGASEAPQKFGGLGNPNLWLRWGAEVEGLPQLRFDFGLSAAIGFSRAKGLQTNRVGNVSSSQKSVGAGIAAVWTADTLDVSLRVGGSWATAYAVEDGPSSGVREATQDGSAGLSIRHHVTPGFAWGAGASVGFPSMSKFTFSDSSRGVSTRTSEVGDWEYIAVFLRVDPKILIEVYGARGGERPTIVTPSADFNAYEPSQTVRVGFTITQIAGDV